MSIARSLSKQITIIPGKESPDTSPEDGKEKEMTDKTRTEICRIPLSELKQNQMATIVRVKGKGASRRRMMDMGIVPGSEIRVIRSAPFGDPVEYSVKGYSLSLRKSEASEILVEVKE